MEKLGREAPRNTVLDEWRTHHHVTAGLGADGKGGAKGATAEQLDRLVARCRMRAELGKHRREALRHRRPEDRRIYVQVR